MLKFFKHHSQFSLIWQRRFGAYFWTQFLGAFNDNILKNALILLIAFQTSQTFAYSSTTMINVAQALLILPFLFFSSLSGQLADKYEKAQFIAYTKLLEIVIMSFAALAFYFNAVYLLMFLLFCIGSQSAIFGTVKYSIIPEQLSRHELVKGNALVESSTFLAILFGTILGGLLITFHSTTRYVVGIALIVIAVLGYFSSRFIPQSTAADPDIRIVLNPFSEIKDMLMHAKENRAVFLSIFSISWFWFFGAYILAQIPNYTKVYLGGNELTVTLLLTCFSIGIGMGALLCQRMSGEKIEIGLVPFGAFGLSIFAFCLYAFAPTTLFFHHASPLIIFQHSMDWYIAMTCIFIGIFGGFYSVPLYVILQTRSDVHYRSRIIALNNIFNALFVIMASIFAIILTRLGLTIPELFLVLALLNILVAIYIFSEVPEFMMRFLAWLIVSFFYRIRAEGVKNIPPRGAGVIICNHISYMDPLIVSAICRRRIRFLMDYRIFHTPVMKFIFKQAGAIPVATAKEDPAIKHAAFETVAQTLAKERLVGIFPEGSITYDGQLAKFRRGIETIIKTSPVPVIPMVIDGLWDSFFSRQKGNILRRLTKQFRAEVHINIGKPIPAELVTVDYLHEVMQQLLTEINQKINGRSHHAKNKTHY